MYAINHRIYYVIGFHMTCLLLWIFYLFIQYLECSSRNQIYFKSKSHSLYFTYLYCIYIYCFGIFSSGSLSRPRQTPEVGSLCITLQLIRTRRDILFRTAMSFGWDINYVCEQVNSYFADMLVLTYLIHWQLYFK